MASLAVFRRNRSQILSPASYIFRPYTVHLEHWCPLFAESVPNTSGNCEDACIYMWGSDAYWMEEGSDNTSEYYHIQNAITQRGVQAIMAEMSANGRGFNN
jgi:hypothetical protein